MKDFLRTLKIEPHNAGACIGSFAWNDDGKKISSVNPSTGEIIATVGGTSKKNYEATVVAAQNAFITWRMKPAPFRGDIVRQIGDLLRKNKSALGRLVTLETGKSLQEGLGEVQEMIDMADFAVGLSRQLYGLSMHSERPQHRMYEQWQPLGVVGVISAFNFPVAVWSWNAFIAAICGNTVIWKPSPKTPLCAVAVQHICNEVQITNNLQGIFSLNVMQKNSQAENFVDDPRISLISFTGSTSVGKRVNEKVAKRLGRSLLEMGGNNAIIVDSTANLKLAVPAIVFGAAGTAGQRCTTTRRLFIHEEIYDELVNSLVSAYKQIKIGDPMDETNLMGPLVDKEAVKNYITAIKAIKKSKGEILFGGNMINSPGFFVEPTIAKAENNWEIVQTETFAPILYIMKFTDLDEAIKMQNFSEHGLSSALFTESLVASEKFLAAIGSDCGIANINIGTSGAEIGGAFGGEKGTGGGREAGSDAWKQYMRRQTTTINWGKDLPLAQGINFDLG